MIMRLIKIRKKERCDEWKATIEIGTLSCVSNTEKTIRNEWDVLQLDGLSFPHPLNSIQTRSTAITHDSPPQIVKIVETGCVVGVLATPIKCEELV